MLAYAPGKEKQVLNAIKEEGGEPFIMNISKGARIILSD